MEKNIKLRSLINNNKETVSNVINISSFSNPCVNRNNTEPSVNCRNSTTMFHGIREILIYSDLFVYIPHAIQRHLMMNKLYRITEHGNRVWHPNIYIFYTRHDECFALVLATQSYCTPLKKTNIF